MAKKAFLFLFLFLFTTNPISALSDSKKKQSKSPSKLKKLESLISSNSISDLLESNVLIELKDGTGSGFFVSRNLIVTNYHVIKNSYKKGDRISFRKQDGRRGWAIIGLIDVKNDLALLRSFSNDGKPLKLGDSSKVQLADDVIIVGSPQGLQGTVSKGIISAKRKDFLGFEEIMQTSAPISPGSSGSPVLLKETHEVIGVAVMVHREGQNLNFLIPINKLKDLMRANKEKMDSLMKNLGKQVLENAKGGDKNAQALLGWSFYHGINWDKDYKRAVYWLSKTRYPKFYEDLAAMYLFGGYGIEKDYKKAQMYISCSPDSSYKSRLLGLMYYDGIGFTTDKDKALSHFLKAIKQGDWSSFNFEIVGRLFFEKGNYLEAAYWFSLSFVKMYNLKNEKTVEKLWDYAISKLTQSQAKLVLSRVKGVLQGKYPIISQNRSFIDSPPCISSSLRQQMTSLEIAQFIRSSRSGDFLKVNKIIKAGIDVNIKGQEGTIALIEAAQFNNLDIVRLLIKQGVDVNAIDNIVGWTALMPTARNGHTDIINLLVKAGADINAIDKEGTTALVQAAIGGHLDIIRVLIKAGADVNLRKNSADTALMGAARNNHTEVINLLIESGADINVKSKDVGTALMNAAMSGRLEAVKTLLAAGSDINAVNDFGRTALIWGAMSGEPEIVKVLLAAGARVKAKDLTPFTPTMNEDVKKVLRKALNNKRRKSTYDTDISKVWDELDKN